MEKSNPDDIQEKVIKFFDGITKALEGLKDRYTQMLFESESKNEKTETILKNWVTAVKEILIKKYIEIFEEEYNENTFQSQLTTWLIKYKENNDLILNAKVLFKALAILRSTIKSKIISSDSLSYMNLTDMLIAKSKNQKNKNT